MRSSGHPRGRGALGGALGGSLAALLVAFVAACGADAAAPEPVWEVIEEVEFADTLGIDLTMMTETPDGIWIQDLAIGTGDTAIVGDTLFVQYTGWLRDGFEFDSGAFPYEFGAVGVIFGFQLGMQAQQVGGTRLMIIPPAWGFGTRGSGPIYPGALLIFEVQLDSIHARP